MFNSVEEHSRKVVQMHSLSRNCSLKIQAESPKDFGETFLLTKLYFGQIRPSGELIIIEKHIDGECT